MIFHINSLPLCGVSGGKNKQSACSLARWASTDRSVIVQTARLKMQVPLSKCAVLRSCVNAQLWIASSFEEAYHILTRNKMKTVGLNFHGSSYQHAQALPPFLYTWRFTVGLYRSPATDSLGVLSAPPEWGFAAVLTCISEADKFVWVMMFGITLIPERGYFWQIHFRPEEVQQWFSPADF